MLAPLKVPLATVVYTALGILLAKFWYDGAPWATLVALFVAAALALSTAPLARQLITSKPSLSLDLFESYSWITGLLTAVATAATVLVTVELAAVAGKEDPLKELVTQASAALTALIGGVVVATKDVDESLGKWIAKEFQLRFTMEGQEPGEKVVLKKDSPSLLAVFTKYENGWTDWSKDNRAARVKSLEENLSNDKIP
jgi:hypothetical protein